MPLPASGAVIVPVGPEFQVNTYTTLDQIDPAILVQADGGFVIAWSSYQQDGFTWGVFARRFDSAGTPLGSEFPITSTVGRQTYPTLAVGATGGFIVTWQGSAGNGFAPDVFGRRFDSSGQPQAAEFQVNLHTRGSQYQPEIVGGDSGFVVVWHSLDVLQEPDQDGDDTGVFARRLGADGTPLGQEIQVNAFTTGPQRHSAVSIAPSGEFVVAWVNDEVDGSYDGVFARRFDAAGVPQAEEFQVNLYTPFSQSHPVVAHDASGDFVIVWESEQDAPFNALGIFARHFDSLGDPIGSEFQVNVRTLGSERYPAVTTLGDGFVVAWQGYDGSAFGITARRLDEAGAPEGREFQVNTHTVGLEERAFAAGAGQDSLVIAWDSNSGQSFGSDLDVFSRLYADPAPLDVDADGESGALTDGVLAIRFLFGLTDATLIAGAVGAECMRCEPADIAAHLGSVATELDVDGDGEAGALTDGILLLRFLFGLDGDALVSGAVGPACSRCSAQEIAAHLEPLL